MAELGPQGIHSPDPELQRLAPLIGAWQTKDRIQDGILGLCVTIESTETYEWLDEGYGLVSTYVTVFDNEPTQRGIIYWGYDPETRQFHTRFFSNNGSYEYVGVVAGGKLTFTGPARFQYDLDGDGKIKVNPNGAITVARWLRDREGNWKPWMNNTFTKLKDSH